MTNAPAWTRRAAPAALLAILAACTEPADTGSAPAPDAFPTPIITADGGVIDPTLDGAPALSFQAALPDAAVPSACTVEWFVEAAGQRRMLGSTGVGEPLSWDGRDDAALPFAPGRAELLAYADCPDGSRGSAAYPLAVVRLAPAVVDLRAATGTAVPLAFHKRDLLTVGTVHIDVPAYRIAEGSLSDDAPVVPPWTDPDLAPWTDDPDSVDRNVPVAFEGGSTPEAAITPAFTTTEGASAIADGVTVRLVSPVAGAWDAQLVAPLDPLQATLGREELALTYAWEACVGTDCTPTPVPGTRTTRHTVYRLAGASALADGSADGYADGTPWIGALSDTADAVEGVAVDTPDAAMDALRDRLFNDPWLVYDPGVGAYSEYDGSYIYWTSIASQLSDWLDRDRGVRLYCHSMSCLLSVLGNTWGLEAQQTVLGVNFRTHLVRAAGTSNWAAWSFNSHSVATLDDGARVWDASVEIDTDEDPDAEPVTALAPKGVAFEDYVRLLTANDIGNVNQMKCFVE
jgi:hypothetical protein